VRSLAVLLVAALLAGCGPSGPKFKNTDITGADWAQDFALTDQAGKPRTLTDFRGKVVVMFFGYVHCPDVCPTTLVELRDVMEKLGEDGKRVQVLFVTLDPERDTPELLAQYVPVFHPSFLALYGNLEQTARVAKEFKVFYQKVPGPTPGDYSMDHTAGSYVFDPNGRVRLFVRQGQIGDLVADIRILLQGG